MKFFGRMMMVLLVAALAACGGGGGGGSRAVMVGQGSGPAFGDSAPHAWVGGHPYDHPVHGIDISRYQGNINWNAVRSSGVS